MEKPKPVYPGENLPTSFLATLSRKCVAEVLRINPLSLKDPSRSDRVSSFGRQLAIHLVHIVCGRRHADVAREFDRNRSTAQHHFEVLENMRDVPEFDMWLTLLEERYANAVNLHANAAKGEWMPTLDALARAVATGALDSDAHFDAKFVVETFRAREPRRRIK